MARTFLFSLKRPDLEIFKLRRLLPDFSPHNLSGLGGSPAPARTLGCWFSRELVVQSGLGRPASPGAGWARGCAPNVASLLFFLLLVSDFHQGPELLVPLLSAMACRPGARASRVGKGFKGCGPLRPSLLVVTSTSFPGFSHAGCATVWEQRQFLYCLVPGHRGPAQHSRPRALRGHARGYLKLGRGVPSRRLGGIQLLKTEPNNPCSEA